MKTDKTKTAFISGGSSGIGQGIAEALAEKGYDIAFAYNSNREGAEKTHQTIRDMGKKCYSYKTALENSEKAIEVITLAEKDLGHIDLLVCNAGRTIFKSIIELETEDLDYLFNLNYRSYMLMAGAAARSMIKNKIKGNIIFITSSRAERAYPFDSHYGGLKAALKRACESIAMELAQFGIRVNCVAPGATAVRDNRSDHYNELAKKIPLERMGTPRDNGYAVAFLASEDAGYITGTTLRLDGGLILPGMPEWDFDNASKRGWGRPVYKNI